MVVGHPSSSVVMGMEFVSAIEIGFPHQISGPPRGCRSVDISVAMLRAMIEGQSGVPPLWAWNASSSGPFFFWWQPGLGRRVLWSRGLLGH